MDVVLILERGKTRTKKIRLRRQATVIGRRRDCVLCIPSAEVSRRHCILQYQDGFLTVEDLDSVNGTFVNDARIAGKEVVYPGDRLAIGPVKFIVQYQLSPSARAMLQATSPTEKAFEFGGNDAKVVRGPGEPGSDFQIVDEIEEADLGEEIGDAELVDVIENPEAGAMEIVAEPDGVEIIDDPGAVEVVEDPHAVGMIGVPDVVEIIDDPELVEGSHIEIIDNPEVVEGSQVIRAGQKGKEGNPVVKKNPPS